MRIHEVEWKCVESWQKMRLMQHVGQRASNDKEYPRKWACLTEVMSEARVSDRSSLEMGDTGDRRSDAPMDLAMDMTTTATPTALETTGATIFEPVERNENSKRRRRRDTLATPCNWRSRIERTIRQQARARTASESSAVDGATSRASAATINGSAATAPDHTNRASTGAMLSGTHQKMGQYAATHQKNARTARGVILHSADSVRRQSRPSQSRDRAGKCNRMDERRGR